MHPIRPHGKLKVSIRACWLKDAKFDADAMTEMSGSQATSRYSQGRSSRHSKQKSVDEDEECAEEGEAEEGFDEQVCQCMRCFCMAGNHGRLCV